MKRILILALAAFMAAPAQAANYTLQCDFVVKTSDTGPGENASPDMFVRETIEFVGGGQAVINMIKPSPHASTARAVVSNTTYILFDNDRDPRATQSEASIDRQTGHYSSTFILRMEKISILMMGNGTCYPVNVAPKM